MAVREYYIGSVGPLLYDDADVYGDSTPMVALRGPQVVVEDSPSDPNHVMRQADVHNDGYHLPVFGAGPFNPVASTDYYFGIQASLPPQAAASNGLRHNIPKAGTIKWSYCRWLAITTAGSNEDVSIYLVLNNTTDILIATVSTALAQKSFLNTGLSQAVITSDYFWMKLVCPAWATPPEGVHISGGIYIE